MLYEAAIERGVTVRFDCGVESLDEDGPSVTTKDGEVVRGDIIIGADGTLDSYNVSACFQMEDSLTSCNGRILHGQKQRANSMFYLGIKSVIRKSMYLDTEAKALDDTGMDITRVNVPFEMMQRNPETADMTGHIALWFGPGTVVANVPVRRGETQHCDIN